MNARRGVPARPLAALTVLVLAAHALALRQVPPTLDWRPDSPRLVAVLRTPPSPAGLHARSQATPQPAGAGGLARGDGARPTSPAPARNPVRPPPESVPPSPTRQAGGTTYRTEGGALPTHAAPRTDPAMPLETAAASSSSQAVQSSPAPAVAVPGPATWHFQVQARRRGQDLAGRAQLAWQHDGREYQALLRLQLPGADRVQHSVGRLGPEGLQPQRFADRLRSEEAAHFDRDDARIVFSTNRPAAALHAGAQDRLSVLLQVSALVAADPSRFVPGTTVKVQAAGTREAPEWAFVVDGEEPIELPAGRTRAIKLTRAPQREYDLRLELWIGPGPDYGPVRLRLTAPNGDWTDLQWSGTDKG